MKVNSLYLNINSENPQQLAAFYSDVVGLPKNPNAGDYAFDVGGGAIIGIDGHSDVSGKSREPQRVLIDLFVDDIAGEQKRLEGAGVQFIRTQGREPWGGVISTFLDPDGNYCQLIEYKPA